VRLARTLYDYLCSLSAPMRIGVILGIPILGIPLAGELLTSPFWGILLGALAGAHAYLLADRKVPGYRALVVLIVASPDLFMRGTMGIPWDHISTGAIVLTFLALAIAFQPGEFSQYLRWSRTVGKATMS
jgi:hypothetical protein